MPHWHGAAARRTNKAVFPLINLRQTKRRKALRKFPSLHLQDFLSFAITQNGQKIKDFCNTEMSEQKKQ